MKWTSDQEKVIKLRDRNILVSAAAGSGKTAVLVERIIQMVSNTEHPVDIDHLLIVTFTKAAAAEMKERIGAAIEKKLLEQPEDEHLQKQMTLVHSAQITTIHSFCQSVIRNNFNVIDLDPAFRIGDDAELTLMKSDVIAELLEEEYDKADEAFLNFVERYAASKSDESIEDLILSLHRFSMSYPWPEEWLMAQEKVFEVDSIEALNQMEYMKTLLAYTESILSDLRNQVLIAVRIAEEPDGPETYLDALEKIIDMMDRLCSLRTFDEYYTNLNNLKWPAFSTKKAEGVDPDKKKQLQDMKKKWKDTVDKLADGYYWQPEEAMLQDIQAAKVDMSVLIQLTLRFMEKFQELKAEKVMLDFNDLEHFTLKILVDKEDGEEKPSKVAIELSEHFEEILCDEYQDSNLVQETILNSISKERIGKPNVFMVGDVKQSIYKFRLAKPELFMEKYNSYDTKDSKYQRIDLHKNFRSRKLVLDAINYICEKIMTKKLGNVEYDADAALYAGAEFEDTKENISKDTELILVTSSEAQEPEDTTAADTSEIAESKSGSDGTKGNGDAEEREEEYTKKELEAKAIALRIKKMVEGENKMTVWDKKKGYRTAEYRDIVILLRTMSGWADVFIDTLLSEGIPAYADTTSGYFETLEIKTILNFLKIVDNPLQDIPFAAVLHSPIGGLTNEDLAILRSFHNEETMYGVTREYAERGDDVQLKEKCEKLTQRLHHFRDMNHYLSIHELILHIYKDTNYYDYVSAMPAGNVRKANLDMLVSRAVTFESTSYKGLFHFIRYIEKLRKYNIDFGEASVSNENDNTVRIMSIHKSKGLEFPIVFVSGMGKPFNNQDSRNKIVIHPDMGLGPEVIDLTNREKAPTLIKKVIQKMQVLENLGEELRVLYVALTRAKEKLIMTGFTKDVVKTFDKFKALKKEQGQVEAKQLDYLMLTSANSFLDYVIPALINHDEVYSDYLRFQNPEYQTIHPSENLVPIRLRVITPKQLIETEEKRQILHELSKDQLYHWDTQAIYDQGIHDQIRTLLEYHYPFQKEVELHAKVTVSELKRLAQRADLDDSQVLYPEYEEDATGNLESDPADRKESIATEDITGNATENRIEKVLDNAVERVIQKQEETGAYIPKFMRREEVVTGAQRGTLYHKVLEEIDLCRARTRKEIDEELRRLVEQDKISEEALTKVNTYQLYQFSRSSLAERMRQAREQGKLYREQQFVMGLEAREVNSEFLSDEIMLVQGIIDVFFEEDGELVLMDYKTDVVRSKNETELVEKYRVQLDYYQKALEKSTGKKVKERIIYSFYLGKEIKVS